VCSSNNSPAPGIGLCVGKRQEESRVIFAWWFTHLVAGREDQVRRDLEPGRMTQPLLAVSKDRVLAGAVFDVGEISYRQ